MKPTLLAAIVAAVVVVLALAACGGGKYAGMSEDEAKLQSSRALDIAIRRDHPNPEQWRKQNDVKLDRIHKTRNRFHAKAWEAVYSIGSAGESYCVRIWKQDNGYAQDSGPC